MALWNFTVDDTSPYLSYSPFVDGSGLMNGWRTWYTTSLYNTVLDEASRGDSYHVSSVGNATVTFQFYGTGISLFGTSNTSFEVAVDNITHTFPNTDDSSLLYSEYGLTNGLHSLTLSAHPSNNSQLSFNSAIVSSPLDKDENPPSPLFYDNSDTASLIYSGAWTTGSVQGVPNTTTSAPFQETTAQGASVSLSFEGSIAIAVKGMTASANGLYSVSLDGMTSTFNGTSAWIIPDALLYFRSGLNPAINHNINITNLGGGKLCLSSITVYQQELRNPALSPGSPKPPAPASHKAFPIGAVIGPVAGIIILCLIGGFVWRRNRHSRANTKIPRAYPPNTSDALTDSRSPNETFLPGPRSPFGGSETVSDIDSLTPLGGGFKKPQRKSSHSTSLNDSTISGKTPGSSSQSRSGYLSRSSTLTHSSATFVDQSVQSGCGSEPDTPRLNPSRRTHLARESIPLSPRRKPLPIIPVPSYYAALQAPPLSQEDVNHMWARQRVSSPEAAPPQYER